MLNFFSTENYLYLWGYRTPISLGNCYHYGIHTQANSKVARKYYLQALKTDRVEALYHLSCLANNEGNKGEAFYLLGIRYEYIRKWQNALAAYGNAAKAEYAPAMYLAGKLFKVDRCYNNRIIIKKDIVTELNWYRKGATLYSAHALHALVEMSQSEPKAALHLAEMYELGEIGNKKVPTLALDYYKKASDLRCEEASYRLAQIYEWGEMEIETDLKKAFDYYYLAAVPDYEFGLKAVFNLERIAKTLDHTFLIAKVAQCYQQKFKRSLMAFHCYRFIANRNDEGILNAMQQLADRNPACAFEWAKFSEKNSLTPKHFSEKYYYYGFAMQNRHRESKKYLENLAHCGDKEAQYTLARIYYEQNYIKKSIFWFMYLVGQYHVLTLIWLKNQSFSVDNALFFAQQFEQENKKIFREWSFFFYKKALAKKSNKAAFRLAQLYSDSSFDKACKYLVRAQQLGYSETACYFEQGRLFEKNSLIKNHLDLACEYYVKAASNHHKCALECLQTIAQSGDRNAHIALAKVYYFQKKFEYAIDWSMRCAEKGYEPAIRFLKNTPFTKAYYLFIAKTYQQGTKEIKPNIHDAIYFYSKAYEERNASLSSSMAGMFSSAKKISPVSEITQSFKLK